MTKMLRALAVVIGLILVSAGAAESNTELRQEGERLFAEGSFARAHEVFAQINLGTVSEEEARWVRMRLAASKARSEASTRRPDSSALEAAETELKTFVAEKAPQDRVWAEAQETLGDLQWLAPARQNWSGAWPYYDKALEHWAGSTNLDLAREKYWDIVRKTATPSNAPEYIYGFTGNFVPLPVLENALRIAQNPDDAALAHYMIAMTLRSNADSYEQRFRVPREFEAALELKKRTRWYDDALYLYGEWMADRGRAVQDENGSWDFQPDYEKALDLFRRITSEFQRGESRWYNPARERIRQITTPVLHVTVSEVFLPGSEVEFGLNWRNVSKAELALYKIDLTRDLTLAKADQQPQDWLHSIDLDGRKPVKRWQRQLHAKAPHAPGSETVRLEERLETGAWMLSAKSGRTEWRELILVSDAALVVHAAGRHALVYFADAASGAPIANAAVRIWERVSDGAMRWREHEGETDGEGIAKFDFDPRNNEQNYFVTARSGKRQAFSQAFSYTPFGSGADQDTWKIYAVTDRPAYRPGETVHWKFTARRIRSDEMFVPQGESLKVQLTDSRGAEVKSETVSLNTFGSAWGELQLATGTPLGEYRMTLSKAPKGGQIESAVLFRVEEYKLPEFKVSIQTPEKNGRRQTFLTGEKVPVEIAAEYYFGGPVANASVELVIRRRNFYQLWTEPRPFEWFYADRAERILPFDRGQVIQREVLKTDREGRAHYVLETPLDGANDVEFQFEARVTDASRREIVGTGSVRVTRQRFYVHAKSAHQLYRPGDKVEVEFHALDANNNPVAAKGRVQVTRDQWTELWIDPRGREVKGDELKRLRERGVFPPDNEGKWRLKFRGYEHDQVLSTTVNTGTNGTGAVTFTPERDGFYRVTWLTDDTPKDGEIPGRPVRAETTVWVATTRSSEIGYRSGGLEIIADRDTFRAGEKAPVMISAEGGDRYVLLVSSGSDLLDYQLLHLSGTVKLVQIDVTEKNVPNFFLDAAMVSDQQIYTAHSELVVPPLKNFLDVTVRADREEYRPGEQGTLQIEAKDSNGQGVSSEVALSVFDASVLYIQKDYAGDPRQVFFGEKRPRIMSTFSSFNIRPYRKLAEKDAQPERFRGKDEAEVLDRNPVRLRGLGIRGEMDGAGGQAPMAYQKTSLAAAAPALAQEVRTVNDSANAAALAGKQQNEIQVRSDFRSTVFWQPDIRTDRDGKASITVTYPDSLTTWKTFASAATARNQFGRGETSTRTKQPLTVRLQAPRFFLAGDMVTVSAVLNNNTGEQLSVASSLEITGITAPRESASNIDLAPNSEARVDWVLHPEHAGEAKIKVTARAGKFGDSMEKSYRVYEHGIEKFLALSGKATKDDTEFKLDLPRERQAGSTRMTVRVTPSLAVTMLDALPYLVHYPYGCTEQTMSRFLPAVITAKTLKELGVNPERVMTRAFGGIEPEHTSKTQPGGKGDLGQLADITAKGLERLADFQHANGGWGWWKEGPDDLYMSAYVVWGLGLARSAGAEVPGDALKRGADFLRARLVELEENPELQVWVLHALSAAEKRPGEFETKAFANCYEKRERLNAYARALLAMAAHHFGKSDEAAVLARNLVNGIVRDNTGTSRLQPNLSTAGLETAHWGNDGIGWHWRDNAVEATAFGLSALLAIDPKNELIQPIANWLIKNRRGAQWRSTRETAIVVLALNEYLRVTGEAQREAAYEVFVNGHSIGSEHLKGEELFSAPREIDVPPDVVRSGENEIRLVRKKGTAPLYFAAEAKFVSLEEPITAAGSELFVARRYYRIRPVATLLNGYVYDKIELKSGDAIQSGDRIETVLSIETKNDSEYLLFEDLKPAGFEAVEVRSGDSVHAQRITGDNADNGEQRWVHQELRDRKVAIFADKLPEGRWEIRYEMRAEIPGTYHALPLLGEAMYVPEIRANSAETRIRVTSSEARVESESRR